MATYSEGVRRINTLRRAELDAAFPGLLDTVLNGGSAKPWPRRAASR